MNKKRRWLRYLFAGAAGSLLLSNASAEPPPPVENSAFSLQDLETKETTLDLEPLLNKDRFTANDLTAATGKDVSLLSIDELTFLMLEIEAADFSGSDAEKKQQLIDMITHNYQDSNLEWYVMNSGSYDRIITLLTTALTQADASQYQTLNFPIASPDGELENPYQAMRNSVGSIIVYNDMFFSSIDNFLITSFGEETAATIDLSGKDINIDLLKKAVLIHEAEHIMQTDAISRSMFFLDQAVDDPRIKSYRNYNKIVQSLEIDSDNTALTYLDKMNASADTVDFFKHWRSLTGALSSLQKDHSHIGFGSHAVHHGLDAKTPQEASVISETYDAFIEELNAHVPTEGKLTLNNLVIATEKMLKQEEYLSPEVLYYANTIREAATFMKLKTDHKPTPGRALQKQSAPNP